MTSKTPYQNASIAVTCDSSKVASKVNSKNCGQCDQPFKKNQKSLNCNVCNYCSKITFTPFSGSVSVDDPTRKADTE